MPPPPLVPVLTSATSDPNITVATSNERWSPAWLVFNGDQTKNGDWVTEVNAAWVSVAFGDGAKTATSYSIGIALDGAAIPYEELAPRDWLLEGWNGNQWVTLDTRANITDWTTRTQTFTIANPGSYTQYRLNISSPVQPAYQQFSVAAWQLYRDGTPAVAGSDPANFEVQFLPPPFTGGADIIEYEAEADDGSSQTVLSGTASPISFLSMPYDVTYTVRVHARNLQGWGEWSAPIMYEHILIPCSPIMTSATTPSPYVVSADSVYTSSYTDWHALNGKVTTAPLEANYRWLSGSGVFPHWWQLDFGSGNAKRVTHYKIWFTDTTDTYGTQMPATWTLQGSNDGSNFTTLDTVTGYNYRTMGSGWQEFVVDTPGTYRYYRLVISANYSTLTGGTYYYTTLVEVEFWRKS